MKDFKITIVCKFLFLILSLAISGVNAWAITKEQHIQLGQPLPGVTYVLFETPRKGRGDPGLWCNPPFDTYFLISRDERSYFSNNNIKTCFKSTSDGKKIKLNPKKLLSKSIVYSEIDPDVWKNDSHRFGITYQVWQDNYENGRFFLHPVSPGNYIPYVVLFWFLESDSKLSR